MPRFIWFGTNGNDDIVVNSDHVIAVEGIKDINTAGEEIDCCRLWLTRPLWDDDDGGQGYVEVIGTLFDTHRLLNGDD